MKINLNTFLSFFLISNVFSTLFVFIPAFYSLSLVLNLVCIVYMIFFFKAQLKSIKNIKNFKILFIGYFIWILITVVRGLSLDIRILGRAFSNPEFVLLCFLPIMAFIPKTVFNFKTINRFLLISNFIYLLFIVGFYKTFLLDLNGYEFISKRFVYANSFLLLTFGYQNRKNKAFVLFCYFFSIFISLFLARRAQVFYLGASGMFSWMLYVLYYKRKYILVNIALIMVLISTGIIYNVDQIFENNFSTLMARIDENTRDTIEEDFQNDMDTGNYIFGKGINGKFKTTLDIDTDYEGDTRSRDDLNYRYGIETGYLNTILKGGILKLFFETLIMLLALFFGFFKSNNLYTKACATFILLYLLVLYPENASAFTFRYLLVWFAVGVCLEKEIRKLNNINFYNIFYASK